jgi:hypothetical protein
MNNTAGRKSVPFPGGHKKTCPPYYYNEVSAGGLNLWGRLSSLSFGQLGMAGWKACPTRLGLSSKYRYSTTASELKRS